MVTDRANDHFAEVHANTDRKVNAGIDAKLIGVFAQAIAQVPAV